MKESIDVSANGQVSKLEVDLDVQPLEDYGVLVSFVAPGDGTRKVYLTLPRSDFEELGSPAKVSVAVSPA